MRPINKKLLDLKEQFERLSIPTQEGFELIALDSVSHLEACNSYTIFHLTDGKKIVATKNMGYYEEELYNDPFLRVHQSYMVNINKVKRYVKADNGFVVMINGAIIQVSRSRKEALLIFFKMRRITNSLPVQPITEKNDRL